MADREWKGERDWRGEREWAPGSDIYIDCTEDLDTSETLGNVQLVHNPTISEGITLGEIVSFQGPASISLIDNINLIEEVLQISIGTFALRNYYNYTTLSDIAPGTGSILTNPLLMDYRVALGSPCINAGATIALVTSDILGTGRPIGANYDIGAWESDNSDITLFSAEELFLGEIITFPLPSINIGDIVPIIETLIIIEDIGIVPAVLVPSVAETMKVQDVLNPGDVYLPEIGARTISNISETVTTWDSDIAFDFAGAGITLLIGATGSELIDGVNAAETASIATEALLIPAALQTMEDTVDGAEEITLSMGDLEIPLTTEALAASETMDLYLPELMIQDLVAENVQTSTELNFTWPDVDTLVISETVPLLESLNLGEILTISINDVQIDLSAVADAIETQDYIPLAGMLIELAPINVSETSDVSEIIDIRPETTLALFPAADKLNLGESLLIEMASPLAIDLADNLTLSEWWYCGQFTGRAYLYITALAPAMVIAAQEPWDVA